MSPIRLNLLLAIFLSHVNRRKYPCRVLRALTRFETLHFLFGCSQAKSISALGKWHSVVMHDDVGRIVFPVSVCELSDIGKVGKAKCLFLNDASN